MLARVVPAPPGRPARPGATDAQRDALWIARDPCGWVLGRASSTAARFDELSQVWDAERGLPSGPALRRWVNALGATAPYFVPSHEILVAMERADTHRGCSVESEALWGTLGRATTVPLRPREVAWTSSGRG